MLIDDRSLSSFGSRGQQRLAVIALKLAEADVISELGDPPVLLLDDVLSELIQGIAKPCSPLYGPSAPKS